MTDIAHGLIDERIDKLERRLAREYSTALVDIKRKLNNYLKDFKKRDAKMRNDWLNGKITRTDYKNWRRNQILTGQRYNRLILELSQDLTNVNTIARNMIYNSLANTFLDAANYTAYELETMANSGTVDFIMYNKDAVYDLIKSDFNLLPPPSAIQAAVIAQKDIQWNMAKINSAITQGILQGEAIGKIASRLQMVTDMNRAQALRNARTLHTQAESKGREQRYAEAEEMGIDIQREWLAVHDNRTRDAHRELDGQIRPIGVPFENSIGKIMYPSDPEADPANVYNCRCQLRGVIKGHEYKTDRYSRKGYEAWKRGKRAYTEYMARNDIQTKYGRF